MKITSCCKTLTYTYTALTGIPMCLDCNKPCTLEDTPESMEERFDKEFGHNGDWKQDRYEYVTVSMDEVKAFITQELARQREEMVGKVEELHTPNIYSDDGVIYQGYASKSKIINLIKEK
jgi:hypothetical protein